MKTVHFANGKELKLPQITVNRMIKTFFEGVKFYAVTDKKDNVVYMINSDEVSHIE